MKPELRSVPRLVLSLSSLVQPVRATRDRQLEVASRFKESESLAVALVKAVAVGAEAILVPPTNDVREALGELNKDLPLLVRTPHTPVADDLRWESSLSLDPGDENGINWTPAKAGAAAMNLLPLSMAADLASRVWPRVERDLSTFSAKSISGVVLPPSVTDLALATQKPRVFERLIKAGRLKAGRVGFETYNLGHLLDAFVAWGFAPDFVMGAVNPKGVGMLPSPEHVLERIRSASVPVIATELRAGGMLTLEEGAAWARSKGVWGLCAELVDLDDVPKEIRALVAARAA